MIVDIDINPLSIDALDMDFEYLSLPKIVFGANPSKISDIQEDEAEGLLNPADRNISMLRWFETCGWSFRYAQFAK